MNELIKVSYENEQPTVLGRDLHEALGIRTAYKDWFPRMCEYGFTEKVDFNPLKFERVHEEGGRTVTREIIDHQLTIEMAKEICMIQRSEIGKKYREYFLELEKQWNTPEAVLARALQVAEQTLARIKGEVVWLQETNAVQAKQIEEMKPKASYYDKVLRCPDAMTITQIAKDYGEPAKTMNQRLHDLGVQFKQGSVWLLYNDYASEGYTVSKTTLFKDGYGTEHAKCHTYWTQKGRLFIYELLKQNGIFPVMERDTLIKE